MRSAQLVLDFAQRQEGAPVKERLTELLGVLKTSGGWMTRRQLEGLGFDERELRELGELDEEGRLFSYPGSPNISAVSK